MQHARVEKFVVSVFISLAKHSESDGRDERGVKVDIAERFFHFWSLFQKFISIVVVVSVLPFLLFCLFSINVISSLGFLEESASFESVFDPFILIFGEEGGFLG